MYSEDDIADFETEEGLHKRPDEDIFTFLSKKLASGPSLDTIYLCATCGTVFKKGDGWCFCSDEAKKVRKIIDFLEPLGQGTPYDEAFLDVFRYMHYDLETDSEVSQVRTQYPFGLTKDIGFRFTQIFFTSSRRPHHRGLPIKLNKTNQIEMKVIFERSLDSFATRLSRTQICLDCGDVYDHLFSCYCKTNMNNKYDKFCEELFAKGLPLSDEDCKKLYQMTFEVNNFLSARKTRFVQPASVFAFTRTIDIIFFF